MIQAVRRSTEALLLRLIPIGYPQVCTTTWHHTGNSPCGTCNQC